MAPKAIRNDYRMVNDWCSLYSNPNFAIFEAIGNTGYDPAGIGRIIAEAEKWLPGEEEDELNEDTGKLSVYSNPNFNLHAHHYPDENSLNTSLGAAKKVSEEFNKIVESPNLNRYPTIRKYMEVFGRIMSDTASGKDMNRELTRNPGHTGINSVVLDLKEGDPNTVEQVLKGLHYDEFLEHHERYNETKRALDDLSLSPEEKKRHTVNLRAELRGMERVLEHIVDPESRDKYQENFQNYEIDLCNGNRDLHKTALAPLRMQIEALDKGWDPAFIEDYANIKNLTEYAERSKEEFDKVIENNPDLLPLKQKVERLAALSPENRKFNDTADFVKYSQELSDVMTDLYTESKKPEIQSNIRRLRNLNESVMPKALGIGATNTQVLSFLDYFPGRLDFRAKGIKVDEYGQLQADNRAVQDKMNSLSTMKAQTGTMSSEAKRYKGKVEKKLSLDLDDFDPQANQQEYRRARDYNFNVTALKKNIEKLSDAKRGELTVRELNTIVSDINESVAIVESGINAQDARRLQYITEVKNWANGLKDRIPKFGAQNIDPNRTFNDQLEECTQIAQNHTAEKFVRNNPKKAIDNGITFWYYNELVNSKLKLSNADREELIEGLRSQNKIALQDDDKKKRNDATDIDNAMNRNWDLLHLGDYTLLRDFARSCENAKALYTQLNDPKLKRLSELTNKFTEELDPRTVRFEGTPQEQKDKFTEYYLKAKGVVSDILAESLKADVVQSLKTHAGNQAAQGTVISALVSTQPNGLSRKDIVKVGETFNSIKRDRFRDKENVLELSEKVGFEREKEAIKRISDIAAKELNKFEALDKLRKNNSDEYIRMKASLARVAGLSTGDHTPKYVASVINALQVNSENYYKSRKGAIMNSNAGEQRLNEADVLAKFAKDSAAEYKTAINGYLSDFISIETQERRFRRDNNIELSQQQKNSIIAEKNANLMTNKAIFRTVASLLKDDANWLKTDADNRTTAVAKRSKDYNQMVETATLLKNINSSNDAIDNCEPAKLYGSIKKFISAANNYLSEHEGKKNSLTAVFQKGKDRISHVKDMLKNVRELAPEIERAYEGIRSEEKGKTFAQLQESNNNPENNNLNNNLENNNPENNNIIINDNNIVNEDNIFEENENLIFDHMENDNEDELGDFNIRRDNLIDNMGEDGMRPSVMPGADPFADLNKQSGSNNEKPKESFEEFKKRRDSEAMDKKQDNLVNEQVK